jgi:hypothetical protein
MTAEKNSAVTYEFMPLAAMTLFDTLRMAIYWREPETLHGRLRTAGEGLDQALYAHDRDGKTLLGLAVEFKSAPMIRMLIKAGAEVDLLMGSLPMTALHKACLTGCIESIEALVEAGADLECPHPINGNTPVMACIGNRHEGAALCLIERGARVDMEQCNMGGSTVADFASICDSPAVFFKLVDRGVLATIPEALTVLAKRGAANAMLEAVKRAEWCDVIASDFGAGLLAACKNDETRAVLQSIRTADQVGCALGSVEGGTREIPRASATLTL